MISVTSITDINEKISKNVSNAFARISALTKPDRIRTEGADWIADSPSAMVVFNVFLSILFRSVRAKQRISRIWSQYVVKYFPVKQGLPTGLGFKTDEPFSARPTRSKPRVLLVIEETVPQCFRYRVGQKMNQLDALGWENKWASWRNVGVAREWMHMFDIVLFYRVPGFPDVLLTIQYAKAIKKITIMWAFRLKKISSGAIATNF